MSYRVGIDSGGTFTDLVGLGPAGEVLIDKVPSNPASPASAVLAGLEGLASRADTEPASFIAGCELIVLGTTVALNALIQQRGARTGLLATRGHEDSIEIRLGHKEDGHRWDFSFPPATPLVPAYLRLGIDERVLSDGSVYTPLDEASVRESIGVLAEHDVEAVAISLMWSFAHPEHEERVSELVRAALPDAYVSTSTEVLPRVGEYTRTSTTVANAYVGPRLRDYMNEIESALSARGFGGAVYYMQSNGGLGTRAILERRPVAALGSGPAAGPVAALHFTSLIDDENVISVDMGGTSFDVCLVKDGLPDVVADVDVARYRVGLPMVNVESIGAAEAASPASTRKACCRWGLRAPKPTLGPPATGWAERNPP